MFRRWGPVLLIAAGIAGIAAYILDVPAMREIYTAPVLGVLIALVVAVDAHRRLPAGSIVIALLVLTLLASALGMLDFGSALAVVGVTLIVVGIVELVLDDDEESGDSWAGIAAFAPRRIAFGESAARVRRVSVTALLTQAEVDLSGLPEHVVEVRAACWAGTVNLVVPADREVLIGSLTDHAVRFGGVSDGIWDASEPERPAVVLRTAGFSGSVFVRRTSVAAALEER